MQLCNANFAVVAFVDSKFNQTTLQNRNASQEQINNFIRTHVLLTKIQRKILEK